MNHLVHVLIEHVEHFDRYLRSLQVEEKLVTRMMMYDGSYAYVDDCYRMNRIVDSMDTRIFSRNDHEEMMMMMMKTVHLDWRKNYSVMMELYHKHYHNDHHENLDDKIVVVVIRCHFQRKVHNEKWEYHWNYYLILMTVKIRKSWYEIQDQIPKRISK